MAGSNRTLHHCNGPKNSLSVLDAFVLTEPGSCQTFSESSCFFFYCGGGKEDFFFSGQKCRNAGFLCPKYHGFSYVFLQLFPPVT
jgi:hypothetical protein